MEAAKPDPPPEYHPKSQFDFLGNVLGYLGQRQACKKIDDEFEIGFRLVAFLEIDPKFQMSESELIKHCRKNLESYKAPNEIKFVNKFPRSSTGKIKRGEIN